MTVTFKKASIVTPVAGSAWQEYGIGIVLGSYNVGSQEYTRVYFVGPKNNFRIVKNVYPEFLTLSRAQNPDAEARTGKYRQGDIVRLKTAVDGSDQAIVVRNDGTSVPLLIQPMGTTRLNQLWRDETFISGLVTRYKNGVR